MQTLLKIEELQLERVEFESDSIGVVFALQGLQDYVNWQAAYATSIGRLMLSRQALWNFRLVNKQCNSSAHNLARWAKQFEFYGHVNLSHLPCFVFCESGDNSVNSFPKDNIAG